MNTSTNLNSNQSIETADAVNLDLTLASDADVLRAAADLLLCSVEDDIKARIINGIGVIPSYYLCCAVGRLGDYGWISYKQSTRIKTEIQRHLSTCAADLELYYQSAPSARTLARVMGNYMTAEAVQAIRFTFAHMLAEYIDSEYDGMLPDSKY